MGEDTIPLVATVKGSLTPLVTDSMTTCVGGSLGTKVAHQVSSTLVLVDQLTPITWKESVSHVAPPANTSGPLLLVLMNREVSLMNNAPVSLGALMETLLLHKQASYTSELRPCETGSTSRSTRK